MELLNAAYALHPAFAEAEILEMGADVRPAFPDNLPARAPAGPHDATSTASSGTASCCLPRWRGCGGRRRSTPAMFPERDG